MRAITLMLKIIWSPGNAFEDIRDSKIGPWIPLLILIVASLTFTTFFLSVVDPVDVAIRQIQQSPQGGNMSQEAIDDLRRTLTDSNFLRILAYVSSVGFLPIWILVISGIYFGIFLVLGSRATFMQFWSVTAFSFTPSLVGTAAGLVAVLTTPPAALDVGRIAVLTAATFMPLESGETAGFLYTFLQTLSVPTLWTLALLVIGYGVVASKKIGAGVRTIAVCLPWLLTVAARVGLVWIFG